VLTPLSDFNKIRGVEKPSMTLPLEKIKLVMHDLLQGLTYCHRNGLMHRNLKPDNILFTLDGILKLSDFALSRIAVIPHFPYTPEDPKERERSGRETRRLWYRAPELLLRKKFYSFEVDMWSLGCIFAELALGEAMFNGDSEIEQLFKIYRITGTPSEELMKELKDGSDNDMLVLPKWNRIDFKYLNYP